MQLPDETTRAFDSEACGLADGSARTDASGSALARAEFGSASEEFGSALELGAVGSVRAVGELGSALEPADVGSPACD
ncbi:hypothetical protein GCM10009555_076900 [Acrocarpospora macrocephala]|uniref:Uncharacterized protein n=1 Tax=Acrocarpospora macrocephala TaxID=150177 RepID=A0A5M3X172_9ACTN|nr:hypothetical protein [Acrocarpospora macrocephala]GES15507.1 hypothetical protein Amac_091040 [Acrocarpospora macrocephala]